MRHEKSQPVKLLVIAGILSTMGNHRRALVRRRHGSCQNGLSALRVQNGLWEERGARDQASLLLGAVLQAGNDGGLHQGGGRGDARSRHMPDILWRQGWQFMPKHWMLGMKGRKEGTKHV